MQITKDSSETKLGNAPLTPLMIKLSLPMILAQVINILYNIVDRIYIGHIKDSAGLALTGVGVCFPILMFVMAFSLLAGSGGAPLAAMELGRAEKEPQALKDAERIFGNAVIMIIAFSIILPCFFLTFRIPILTAFGASKNTINYADDYISIYLLGTCFVQISCGLNPFITAQGHARTAMLSTLIGAILNIILDPIFIFVFDLGVKGAAIATVLSQAASALWILLFLSSKKSAIRLRLKILYPHFKTITKITSLGAAAWTMSATESAIFIVFNTSLQKYGGDIFVGTMTILQSLMQMCFVPAQGFSQGVQPIISYNYGAKKMERVLCTIRRMTIICFTMSLIFCSIVLIFPKFFVSLFSAAGELRNTAIKTLPIYFCASWLFGVQMGAQGTFVALGMSKTSVFIALLRKVILLIPLALVLPRFFGVNGIFAAEPIASTTSAITSFVLLIIQYKKLKSIKY